jgi:hypothetical protein
MPDLKFQVTQVAPAAYAAAPAVTVGLRIGNEVPEEVIQSISLNCQVQLQPLGRPYSALEEAKLLDLFGERSHWGQTMKPLHWTNAVVKVPPFTGRTDVELQLPCSLDFDVAANKYFYGLSAGAASVSVMFSGTVFYSRDDGSLQVAQIPWDREVRFQLPVEVWKGAIDAHYPDMGWLRLPRETFDRLYRYKVARSIPFWKDLIEQLLDDAERNELATGIAASGSGQ